jgi:peptidoglycan hydrolase CwlO-like protein
MAKINSETSKNELVELALAGLEVQIRELNDKKEELKKLLVSSPAAKRTAKAVKVARAGGELKLVRRAWKQRRRRLPRPLNPLNR